MGPRASFWYTIHRQFCRRQFCRHRQFCRRFFGRAKSDRIDGDLELQQKSLEKKRFFFFISCAISSILVIFEKLILRFCGLFFYLCYIWPFLSKKHMQMKIPTYRLFCRRFFGRVKSDRIDGAEYLKFR